MAAVRPFRIARLVVEDGVLDGVGDNLPGLPQGIPGALGALNLLAVRPQADDALKGRVAGGVAAGLPGLEALDGSGRLVFGEFRREDFGGGGAINARARVVFLSLSFFFWERRGRGALLGAMPGACLMHAPGML